MISEMNRNKEDGIITDHNPISHFYGGMGLVPQPLPVNSHDDGFVENSYAMSTNSHRRNSISQRSDSSSTQQLPQNAGASQSRRRSSQVEVSCNTCGKKYKNQIWYLFIRRFTHCYLIVFRSTLGNIMNRGIMPKSSC